MNTAHMDTDTGGEGGARACACKIAIVKPV